MKKTLIALAITAFASSASAFTIYEQDGSKVDFFGSVRLRLDKETSKKNDVKSNGHSNLHNNGSRFGVKLKHEIADDFYAIGRVDFFFNSAGSYKTTDGFGDLYARRAYVGLGSKKYGELTFGRQETMGADVPQSAFSNYYGTFEGTLTDVGRAVVRYDYKGVEGLQLGLDYRFAESRASSSRSKEALRNEYIDYQLAERKDKANKTKDAKSALDTLESSEKSFAGLKENEILKGELKGGYGASAVYTFEPAKDQSLTLAAGYTRDNFVTESSKKHHKDAYQTGISYTVNDLTLAADYYGSFEREGKSNEYFNGFHLGVSYDVTDKSAVYATYGHGKSKKKSETGTTTKTIVGNRYVLGTSYSIHKNVYTFVEGGFGNVHFNESGKKTKRIDQNIAVGLNVNW